MKHKFLHCELKRQKRNEILGSYSSDSEVCCRLSCDA